VHLPLIAGAHHLPSHVASFLQRRQQQRNQQRDDADHHQKFDQGKSAKWASHGNLQAGKSLIR